VLIRLAVLTALVVSCRVAFAATYCVSSVSELSAALEAGATDSDTVRIELVRGDYAGDFAYVREDTESSPSVFLSGGWDVGCASMAKPPTHIAGSLVFTGKALFPIYPVAVDEVSIDGYLRTNTSSTIDIEDVQVGGAFTVECCGSLTLERSLILGANIDISTAGNRTSVMRNNVFAGSLDDFYWIDQTDSPGSLIMRGNTFHFAQGGITGVIWFGVEEIRNPASFEFSRNLVTHTPTLQMNFDMDLDGNGDFIVPALAAFDNWIGFETNSLTLSPDDLFSGKGNVVGDFALPYVEPDDATDVHLRAGSPMIDYSEPQPQDFDDFDRDGHPRVFDGRVDVGAYEQLGIFRSGFDVASG
jgi:hypothetical protein